MNHTKTHTLNHTTRLLGGRRTGSPAGPVTRRGQRRSASLAEVGIICQPAEWKERHMLDVTIRSIEVEDREWILHFLRERWGSERMVAHGKVYHPADLPGSLAMAHGGPAGMVV